MPAKDPMQHSTEDQTPLTEELRTQIMGFARLLEGQPDCVKKSESVQTLLASTRRLLDTSQREVPAPALPDDSAAAQMNCDVLYIEDDPVNFALVSRIFETRPSLRLHQATAGETGVEMALSQRPKLILLDLNLPDIHGSEVVRRLQAYPTTADIPVVVVSADATPSQIERLLSAGARNYLTKPFNIQKFLGVIDDILEGL